MTERRKFDLVKKIGDFEIRKYHPCVMAYVVVNSGYQNAGNIGFRPLVTYISQNQIAMTAPVVLEEKSEDSWVVSFVMPAEMKLADLPLPKNSKVTLRQVPEHHAASLSFSGLTPLNKITEKEKALRNLLAHEGLTPIGPIQIARFDPPWKPSFMRHNEVIIPINY